MRKLEERLEEAGAEAEAAAADAVAALSAAQAEGLSAATAAATELERVQVGQIHPEAVSFAYSGIAPSSEVAIKANERQRV